MEYIFEIDDFFSEDFCKEIIKKFEEDPNKQPGETLGGVNKKQKDSTDLYIFPISLEVEDTWAEIRNSVMHHINKGFTMYIKYLERNNLDPKYNIGSLILHKGCIDCPQIQRTDVNGFFDWHHDNQINRLFTYIVYLNDVEKNCGGTTDFLCGKSVLPKTGKLVIFPANITYPHKGEKLKRGVKYIMTGWLYNDDPLYEHPKYKTKQFENNISTYNKW